MFNYAALKLILQILNSSFSDKKTAVLFRGVRQFAPGYTPGNPNLFESKVFSTNDTA